MEIIRRITEFRDKRILLYPFWRRLLTFSMISGFLVFYHHAVANWGFDDCSKEDCPPLEIWDNPNEWKYPQKAYMEPHQTMMKEIFLLAWVMLIPDWHKVYKHWLLVIRQKFADYYNQINNPVEEVVMEKPVIIDIEMTAFDSDDHPESPTNSYEQSYV